MSYLGVNWVRLRCGAEVASRRLLPTPPPPPQSWYATQDLTAWKRKKEKAGREVWKLSSRGEDDDSPIAVLALCALGCWGVVVATLEPAERAALGAMLEPRAALLLLGWLVLAGGLGWLARAAYLRWVAASARLAEEARVLLAADVQREIEPAGSEIGRAHV